MTTKRILTRDLVEPLATARIQPRRRWLLPVALLALVAGGYFAWTHFEPAQQTDSLPALSPPTVTVSAPLAHRMANWSTFTGQFSPVDRVEIRAQVSGYLTEIHFKDGQSVKKGDLLFVIDPRPYEIALANAPRPGRDRKGIAGTLQEAARPHDEPHA